MEQEILSAAIDRILHWELLLALLSGSLGGILIGAIPGVGAAVAIAILLPVTYSMDPLVGLTLLLGIYSASMFGGALPSILINTPGTPVNALTTYDGYPMTCQGKSHQALSLAYGASFFSGVLSIIALILLTPYLAQVATYFGSREIFLAALLGIVMVVLAHRCQVLVAAFLMGFGILLSTIGMEPVMLTTRYTFGFKQLNAGINLIPVILGIFAISQAFNLLGASVSPSKTYEKMVSNPFKEFLLIFKYKFTVFYSSLFGIIMGIIPGVGEFIAQFFSYNVAKKLSKTPEMFGKGAPEGLVASEAANNAVPPAAMIPLLTLGIPGEALTAMMLSVFRVHNIIPGPRLFEETPDLVVSLYICMLLTNVIILIFLLFSTNTLVRIIQIPERFLGAIILTLSLIGVYTIRSQIFDCVVAVIFGIVGLALRKLKWPLIPIVLGLVLGQIAETKFRSGMARIKSVGDLFERPVSQVLGLLILFCIFSAIIYEVKESINKKRKASIH